MTIDDLKDLRERTLDGSPIENQDIKTLIKLNDKYDGIMNGMPMNSETASLLIDKEIRSHYAKSKR